MTLTNKYFIQILTLLVFIVTISWAATPAQSLQKRLNNVRTLQANFIQKDYAQRRLLRTFRGTVKMAKPGKFRWEINSPSQVIMLSNGKKLWVYQKDLSQVTVQPVKKNHNDSPAMILSNRIRLLGNYFTVWKEKNWYYLNPKYGNSQIKQVQLYFVGNQLKKMWILDKLGQRVFLQFTNIRTNLKLAGSNFVFRAPKGVDVIH